jgi:Diguanylate cyclase, GGDEF domain
LNTPKVAYETFDKFSYASCIAFFFPVVPGRNLPLYYNKSGIQYKDKKEIFRLVRANAGQIYHRTGSNNKTNDITEVNDEHGYLAGDAVRKNVAAQLPTLAQKSDYIVRHGDENFLGFLSRILLCNAVQTVDRVR